MSELSTTPSAASAAYLQTALQPSTSLREIMGSSERPDVDALVGWEWRGLNVAWWAGLLGIRKFVKGFYREPSGEPFGYNAVAAQNPRPEPWRLQPSEAQPKRFGFFQVAPVDPASRDRRFANALLIDYGRGRNPWYAPIPLRDYLVRVQPGSDELLLGYAELALGPLRIPTPGGYFLLERLRPVSGYQRP